MKLGMLMIVGTVGGVEVGVRILNWIKNMGLANEVVLSVSICMLLMIGIYTFGETRQRKAELDGMARRKEELPSDMKTAYVLRCRQWRFPLPRPGSYPRQGVPENQV